MAPPFDAVLYLDRVSVLRDGARLLDRVEWTVREGERWVVIGPNGAGKTTLLQVAAALLYPSEGVVEVLGERLGEVDVFELRPRIGVTSAAFADRLPGGGRAIDVVLTAAYATTSRGREVYDDVDLGRARHLLRFLGCEVLAERRYGTLSEGERKRVQIARAMMADPELLLLDEPAAGLDLGAREALVLRLSRIAADATAPTTVLVTHHVEEIPRGFTHALLLSGGRVVSAGKIDEALTSEALSACFGVPLRVDYHDGRYAARIAVAAS
ncbi:MAG: iron complex transport system ATP-binding protein [Frankiales bacterium]|jgi:iron complex transport system ATP-binding protein|nr:iron complex transport system ATP-binding protein [Frankiales bacterium]